jgi:probable rRNA maturation factor
MTYMKKHSFIQFDFHSSVKIHQSDKKKLLQWLSMASEVMEKLIHNKKLIHSSWLQGSQGMRISILLCGDAKMKKLNAEYRGKNKVTDVLSFPSFESLRKSRPRMELLSPEIFLGDLAICHRKIIEQARDFDITYWDEFIHLVIHGMIHLMGYDHEISPTEERIMQEWENVSLNLFSKIKKKGP